MQTTGSTQRMKTNTLPKIIALMFAIIAHLVILWLWQNNDKTINASDSNTEQANFEISLLPAEAITPQQLSPADSTDTSAPISLEALPDDHQDLASQELAIGDNKPPSEDLDLNSLTSTTADNSDTPLPEETALADQQAPFTPDNSSLVIEPTEAMDQPPKAGHEIPPETDYTDIRQLEKPELYKIEDSEREQDTNPALQEVFSPTLKKQIVSSQKTQKEYLKTQKKETRYPITEDADGTRYVNIKGVCWRMPKDNQKEEWTVVLSGCGGQTKTFLFELNIAPDILGADSPFDLPQ